MDIEKKFRGFHLSQQFSAGDETLGLLGASGCGKSLTMRSIAGIEKPDAGKIVVNDTVFFDKAPGKKAKVDLSPQQRKTALLFQNYMLFPNLTIEQNVAAGLPKGVTTAERAEAIREQMQRFGLLGMEKRYPVQLSGGQQQRVALARVLAVEPQVLLLDEPFGALDAQVREELRQWIKRLHRELGFTGVFVTHDQEEAMQVADRVVVMHNGRIEQADKPAEIWEHPKTRFVIEFLSDVNRIPAMISNGRLHVGTVDLALDGGADGRPVVDPKSIPDGPADLLLRPKDARMRRLEAEEDSAAAQKAGLLPVVIRSAVPKGGAIQVEAEPEGWYENALNAYVLEDALPRLGRGYLMSFERAYLYRGEERLPVHVRKPRWPFVGEHGHEHSSPEAAEPPKALKHEAALFI